MTVDMLDPERGEKVIYLAPSRHRIEGLAGTIYLIDTADNKSICLNTETKEALIMEWPAVGHMTSTSAVALVQSLRVHFRTDRVDEEGILELGEREIDGVLAIGLRSSINGEVVEAWVDPTTYLPLEIRFRLIIPAPMADGSKTTMWHVMTSFQYDVEIDETLMAMRVPDGYTVLTMPSIPLDRSPASLDDLISLLRVSAEHNGFIFPLSLTVNDEEGSCLWIMKRYADELDKKTASGSDADRQAAVDAITQFGTLMGRTTPFLHSLKEENDLQYFGGARLNQKNRPLFWYSPAADGNYKVVYADLSVQDATADSLPPKPAPLVRKKRREGPTNVAPWSTPLFSLPRRAIRDYASLQEIRTAGKQADIEYLTLGWMPEFIESPARHADGSFKNSQVSLENWKPNRSPDSARLAFLEEFPNLKGLDLIGLYLTQKDLDTIGRCTKLERLSLNGIQILTASPRRLNGDDLQKLGGLINLRELDLGQSNFVGGLQHLSQLPRLRRLYLGSFENLNDKSVSELQMLPHLETLVLSPVYGTNPQKQLTEVGLRSLQNLSSLRTLYVGWHGEWTMPVDTLQALLPQVKIKAGE